MDMIVENDNTHHYSQAEHLRLLILETRVVLTAGEGMEEEKDEQKGKRERRGREVGWGRGADIMAARF